MDQIPRRIVVVSSSLWSLSWFDLAVLIVAILGFVFVCCLYILHVTALCYGKYRLHRKVKFDRTQPGVSIIKPLVGVDANLAANLETFFTLHYHQYELLFCVYDRKDAAVEVVKRLMNKYPTVDAKIFYGGEHVGLNPKINNMMPAWRSAKYPLILISDSGILMLPDALMDMVNTMKKGVAIVTQMPYCKDREGVAGAIEQIYFGTSHGRIYLAGNCMGFVCSTGMSSLLRKSAMEECGGIRGFSDYLAEDFFFGLELNKRGWKAAISTFPALQNTAHLTVSSFHARICRWMKLRIAMLPHIIVVEPLQDCFASGLVMSVSCWYLFRLNPVLYFTTHCLLWFASDYTLIHIIQNGRLPFSFRDFTLRWMLREGLGPVNFFRALLNPDIKWRNGKFRLHWGGKIRIDDAKTE